MSGFKRKYEFKRFADGMPHVLNHGEHYDTPDLTFCKTAWMWAERHGYRLQFQRLGGRRCRLQFTPTPGQEPA